MMHLEARTIPGPQGTAEPVMVDIPVTHKQRLVGKAELNSRGELSIKLVDGFDITGIWAMFMRGEGAGIEFGVVKELKDGSDRLP